MLNGKNYTMLKKFLKKLAIKIYSIGKQDELCKLTDERKKLLNQVASFDESVYFYPEALVVNHLNDKTKIAIGKEGRIIGQLVLYAHGGEILIGDHCFVGKDTRIWSAKKISIGNRVLIAHNVNIHDNTSHPLNSKLRHEDFLHIFSKGHQTSIDLNEKEIIIEDDVWIGFNATIQKGVTVGRGSIIGANSVITKDVPAYSVIVGNPQRILRQTD